MKKKRQKISVKYNTNPKKQPNSVKNCPKHSE